ncbi:MAG TPA: hypothetical protein VK589_29775 [Chryseolinea sp.]|nr:hypothetical protein [Chryseolinea sp.]
MKARDFLELIRSSAKDLPNVETGFVNSVIAPGLGQILREKIHE